MQTNQPSTSLKHAIQQQKLKGWQPILTARSVLPILCGVTVGCFVIGCVLLYTSDRTKNFYLDYTNCLKTQGNDTSWTYLDNTTCWDIIRFNITEDCYCRVRFDLEEDLNGRVFMYYGLSNFYQNHRRYVRSLDDYQLLGNLNMKISSNCAPYDYVNESGVLKPIAPCGAIANSMFNDTLSLFYYDNDWKTVPLLKTGIVWETDKRVKFGNPPGDLKKAFQNFSKPIYWRVNVWELDEDNEDNNGFLNEDLIAWMRTAAFSKFIKPYRRINHDAVGYEKGLPSGDYILKVKYNYDVSKFGGTKRIALTTTSFMGGKNDFLGKAYLVTGSICFAVSISLIFLHHKYGKSENQIININSHTSYFERPEQC